MFDVYYCSDEQKAKLYFNTKQMPREIPALYIIDPKSKKEVKPIKGLENETQSDSREFYFKKYQGFIFNIS